MIQPSNVGQLNTAQDVTEADLNYICSYLNEEFFTLSGQRLLITGGAGFLGYYLVQAVLHWNSRRPDAAPIRLTVFDNFMRGGSEWLTSLETDPNLTLVKHDITHPLPGDMEEYQYIIHAASIASPTYYRKFPIETMD